MADFWESLTAPFTGKPIEEAARLKAAGLEKGYGIQSEQYGAGRGALTDQYTRALDPYNRMLGSAMSGYEAYRDASGAAGRPGQERAQANFMTDPGVMYAQNQQIDAMNRAANARGVSVGTNVKDVMDYVNANSAKQYGSYVDRLAPWLGQGQQTAAGLGGIYTGLGGELNRSFTGQGDAAMRAYSGIGGAQAEGALAPMAAGSNIWGAGMGLANMIGGMGGLGGIFGQGGAFGRPFNPNQYSQTSSPLQTS